MASALWRAGVLAAIALPAFGCLPFGPTATQSVQVMNSATAQVRVRIGPFVAGQADVPEDKMLEEVVLQANRNRTFTLPLGRYNIEAVAITTATETAVTSFTLTADKPANLQLQEKLYDEYPRPTGDESPAPVQQATRKRILTWFEN